MTFRTLQLSTAAACALLVSGWAAGAEVERPRTISVSGQGEIQAEPDRALVTLGVEARKPKMEDARNEVSKTVDAVLKLTRDLKIDQKYVRTTRVNVQPEYNWDNNAKERNLIGYFVSRQIEIELRDLDKLGQLMEKSFDLGVNSVGDPRLDSTKRRDLEREALAKAVADAKLNAEAVAKAANARLGAPRTISASSGFVPPPVPMMKANMARAEMASDAAGSYQSGQMGFNGNVQVEYDLIPNEPGLK
ncbi:SIMPL domain-containing protein [Steroidobacter agaridevorans]|uniref:SIMPL domain-containing protein n=1 Tax=Steroidobacter agaridevorans TaxID=2695856 RepID=A0A829Y501_9GAMM|nr:SIMPL domain-containing protein [Steroidobacter agaridevorans]GFE78290.1 SIMPL domain-containing protein [Steroidobacter agaridevorans]GFE89777.1 SIMPL domain-containing protein [Steroidobacter agaridevorans]